MKKPIKLKKIKQILIVIGAALAAIVCGTTNSFDFIRPKIQKVKIIICF